MNSVELPESSWWLVATAGLLPSSAAGKLPSVREGLRLPPTTGMRFRTFFRKAMAKRKRKQSPFIHPVFLEMKIKPVKLPKPKDPCHDEIGFERALIDWIVAHRGKRKGKRKSGG